MDVQKGRKKKYKESMQRKRILFNAPYTPTDINWYPIKENHKPQKRSTDLAQIWVTAIN